MRNILKGLLDPEAYRFPSAEELELEAESPPEAPGEEEACEDIAAPPGVVAALVEEAPYIFSKTAANSTGAFPS